MLPLLAAAFTALPLLLTGASAVIEFPVLPPTDVTISCQNEKVTASWNHGAKQETSFRLETTGTAGHWLSETPALWFDLSDYIWSSEQNYMDVYFVSVTAVQRGNESQPATSKTFTFNLLKTADVTCQLDFPPVDLILKDFRATVSFRNPANSKAGVRRAPDSDSPIFEFIVKSVGDQRFKCLATDENCKQDMVLPDNVTCVRLSGLLHAGNLFGGQVQFRETDQVCDDESAEVDVVVAVILSLAAAVMIVAGIIICKVKAWTMKTPKSSPQSLNLNPAGSHLYNTVPDTDISEVRVGRPGRKLSLSSEEEGAEPDERLQGGGVYLDGVLSDSSAGTDGDSTGCSDKTECALVEEEEEEEEGGEGELRSPYDCPHVLQLDMGDGDMVTGYTDR